MDNLSFSNVAHHGDALQLHKEVPSPEAKMMNAGMQGAGIPEMELPWWLQENPVVVGASDEHFQISGKNQAVIVKAHENANLQHNEGLQRDAKPGEVKSMTAKSKAKMKTRG